MGISFRGVAVGMVVGVVGGVAGGVAVGVTCAWAVLELFWIAFDTHDFSLR